MTPGRTLFGLLVTAVLLVAGPASAETVQIPGPSGPLSGTFEAAPGKGAPIMLMVPGSGAVDRDGNNANGLHASTYRLLADGLAKDGISTLRIDKRGLFGSGAAIPDPNNVTIDDYAADVGHWIDMMRRRSGARCIWLSGHSEGGLVALEAARRGAAVCGLVLVATPGRRLGDVIRAQLEANPANSPILPQALSILRSLEAGRRVDRANIDPVLLPLFRPSVQGLLISELRIDPAADVAGSRVPVLVLQGGRDLQVGLEDARRLASARPDVTLRIVPDANHMLKPVASDSRALNIATYSDPALPLAHGVVGTIATFVMSHRHPAGTVR